MDLSAFDVIIIAFFFILFKWLFRFLAVIVILKIIQAVKEHAAKAIKEKLGGEPDAEV